MSPQVIAIVLCALIPLALVFLLPYIGITLSSGIALALIMILCLLIPLLMAGRQRSSGSPQKRTERHSWRRHTP